MAAGPSAQGAHHLLGLRAGRGGTMSDERKLGSWDAAFIGIGAMVGAGIFALLGAAGEVAGSAVWLSFLLAGGVAALQGYSFAKFGSAHPSSGGLLEYVARGFGDGHILGVIGWLRAGSQRHRDRDGGRVVRELRQLGVHGGRHRHPAVRRRRHRRHDRPQPEGIGGRRPSPDRRRHGGHRHPRGVHRRDRLQPRPRPARPVGLPAVPGHRGQRGVDVLRLPRASG